MFKLITIAALTILGAASASFVKTPASIFAPDAATITRVCNAAYTVHDKQAVDAALPYEASLSLGDHQATFWSSLSGVFTSCRLRNQQFQPKKIPVKPEPVNVALYGRVLKLVQAKDWAVALSARDVKGKELSRVLPDKQEKYAADTRYWNVSCRSNHCLWSGSNYYQFTVAGTPFLAAVKRGARVVVMARRYGMLDEYALPAGLK